MLTLYTHPLSPCAQKVRMTLYEKGLEWTAVLIDLAAKENLKPEYLALNSLGVVPTLVHNGVPIVESSIICEYLEDTFPSVRLRPASAQQTAEMRLWMKHVDTKLHPACGAIQWPMVMREGLLKKSAAEQLALIDKIPEPPRRERQRRLLAQGLDAPDVKDGVDIYRQTVLKMERVLAETEWLVSAQFSLADACVAPYFQTLTQFKWTKLYDQDCPRVVDWYSRCCSRASYQHGVLSDFTNKLTADLAHRGEAAWPKIHQHLVGL